MRKFITFFVISILYFPLSAQAVLPPDVIFSIGTQVSSLMTNIGILLLGGFMAITPFLREIIEKIRAKKGVFITIGFVVLVTASVFLIAGIFNPKQKPIVQEPITSTSSASYRFYSDRFVIAKKDTQGRPFLLDLIINRKENQKGGFIHYYLGNIISGIENGKFYKERVFETEAVLPDLFFTEFERKEPTDHSSRETYVFTFSLLGKTYSVKTDELVADFITKNNPEYTQYASAGTAQVTVDEETFKAPIMHQKVYSEDYRPTIFFDEQDNIRSKTLQLVLWSDAGDFFLVDKSEVIDFSPAYTSHFWALMKSKDGYSKKAFKGSAWKETKNGVITFSASVPDFKNIELRTILTHQFDPGQEKGWVESVPGNGTTPVYGLGYYNEYGKGNQ